MHPFRRWRLAAPLLVFAATLGAADFVHAHPHGAESLIDEEIDRGELFGSKIWVVPQMGDFTYDNLGGANEARFILGARLNYRLNPVSPEELARFHFGIGTGVFITRIGDPDAHFFSLLTGTDAPYLYEFPLQIWTNYRLGEQFSIQAYAGADVLYFPSEGAIETGRSDVRGSGATWFPSIAGALGWDVGNFGLTLEGRFTFTPADEVFTGLAGLAFPL